MKKDKFININKESKDNKKNKEIKNKILVNLITFVRSLGTIAIFPIFGKYGSLATGASAIVFFLTDFIDGKLARKLHVQTFFGSLLDALSDKTFGIACLLILSTLNPIFLAIIAAELGITAINVHSFNKGNNVQSSYLGKVKTAFLGAAIVGSYFCYGAPELVEILNYLHVSSLDKLATINPDFASTLLAIPTLGASALVGADYARRSIKQEKEHESISKKELTPEEIENLKAELQDIKSRAAELKSTEERTKPKEKPEFKEPREILENLFDTPFYLEHKDDGVKALILKHKESE